MILIIYHTDGSAWPNPGHGGFAVVKNGKQYMAGTEDGKTSNIRMEGAAILAALEDSVGRECLILTDSKFWVDTILLRTETWERNNWKTNAGKDVKNLNLVKNLYRQYLQNNATLQWIRGHNKEPGNELADDLAGKARKVLQENADESLLPDDIIIAYYQEN